MSKSDDGRASEAGVFADAKKTVKQLKAEFMTRFKEYKQARTSKGNTVGGVSMNDKLMAVNAMISFLKAPSKHSLNDLLDHRRAFQEGKDLPALMADYIKADMQRMDITRRCDKSALDAWFDSRSEELNPQGGDKFEN